MVSVPFIEPMGWQVALTHCFALACVNLLYFMRAKTEERHLMNDPDYRAYAEWIAKNGLVRFQGSHVRFNKMFMLRTQSSASFATHHYLTARGW